MTSRLLPIRVVFAVLVVLYGRPAVAQQRPCWIWGPDQVAADDEIRFAKTFQTDATTNSIQLRFAQVSAHLKIALDGEVVAVAEPYDPIQTVDLETRLQPGDHELVVLAQGVRGPSAFFLQLDLSFENAGRQAILASSDWRVNRGVVTNHGPVERGLIPVEGRRVGIDVVDNYEQWKQALGVSEGANPGSFLTAPGFEIRLVRSALPNEDSWVSLAFDPEGRAIIAKEQTGLLRMTLSQDGEEVKKVELINDSLLECRGLAFIGTDLYANANNSKGLYRLRRENDGFAQPELLYESTGGVGHGRNDLAVGPDGKLYSIHGDSVSLPANAFDHTSPFRDARRGQKTSEGHLLRIDPESGGVELLAAGLRNPFGIDFNNDGECFTYDADAEFDMGSPWYRPTRVSHLVSGGDYGWRGVTNSWPPYYPDHPDNARPNLDIGKGSPTAVKFGTRSSFPSPYRDALFILDWAYGRIIAVHMIPRGSSYLMAAETFLKGRPLNVTDLDFAPDGSMYFITGGRKTQSALYRIRYADDRDAVTENSTPQRSANARFAMDSRRLRRELEAKLWHPPAKELVASVWHHLSNPDPWIRHAAVNVLEHHPTSMWQRRALSESEITPAVHVLTALARSGRRDVFPAVLRRLNQLMPEVELPSDKLTAFYAYWLCIRTTDDIDDQLLNATASLLNAGYPSYSNGGASYAHNRLLSEVLIKLGSGDAVEKTMGLLKSAKNQREQMHYLYVLRNARTGWSPVLRCDFFASLAQSRHYSGGAGMSGFLTQIREEAVATLSDGEREQLGSLIEDAPPITEVVRGKPGSLVRRWTVDKLLSPAGKAHQPDRSRGADIFASASCINCHRFGARGTLIGPDLTSVSRRFSRRDLLTSIIEPSKVIAENYRSLQIVTADGRIHIGQATLGGDFRSPILRLATDPMRPFSTIEIPKNEIQSQQLSEVSWMPKGLLDTFTRGEIMDLIAYLESGP